MLLPTLIIGPVMWFASPPGPSEPSMPIGAPEAELTANPLGRLSPSDRRQVEEHAKEFRRFSDGSLWTQQVASQRARLPRNSPLQEAYALSNTPFWYCPATGETAESDVEILHSIQQKQVAATIKGGRYIKDAFFHFRTDQGFLIEVDEQLALFEPHGRTDIFKEGTELPPFVAIPAPSVLFHVPLGPLGASPVFSSGERHFRRASSIQVLAWVEVELPKSYVAPSMSAVTPAELAAALKAGQTKLLSWNPKRVRPPGEAHYHWAWMSRELPVAFHESNPTTAPKQK